MRAKKNCTLPISERPYVKLQELAEIIGCGTTTARRLAEAAKATIHLGRSTNYDWKKVVRYLESQD